MALWLHHCIADANLSSITGGKLPMSCILYNSMQSPCSILGGQLQNSNSQRYKTINGFATIIHISRAGKQTFWSLIGNCGMSRRCAVHSCPGYLRGIHKSPRRMRLGQTYGKQAYGQPDSRYVALASQVNNVEGGFMEDFVCFAFLYCS